MNTIQSNNFHTPLLSFSEFIVKQTKYLKSKIILFLLCVLFGTIGTCLLITQYALASKLRAWGADSNGFLPKSSPHFYEGLDIQGYLIPINLMMLAAFIIVLILVITNTIKSLLACIRFANAKSFNTNKNEVAIFNYYQWKYFWSCILTIVGLGIVSMLLEFYLYQKMKKIPITA